MTPSRRRARRRARPDAGYRARRRTWRGCALCKARSKIEVASLTDLSVGFSSWWLRRHVVVPASPPAGGLFSPRAVAGALQLLQNRVLNRRKTHHTRKTRHSLAGSKRPATNAANQVWAVVEISMILPRTMRCASCARDYAHGAELRAGGPQLPARDGGRVPFLPSMAAAPLSLASTESGRLGPHRRAAQAGLEHVAVVGVRCYRGVR